MLPYILFDLDGTLVDSREVFVASFNVLAEKHKFKKIRTEEIDALMPLSMIERMRFLQVPMYKLPLLTNEFLSLYRSRLRSIPMVAGMTAILQQVRDMGYTVGIVSSNSAPIIRSILNNNGIDDISEIHCSSRLFGKHRLFMNFLRQKKVPASQVIYVCDERRDIEACRKVGITPIWVSWGFETRIALQGEEIIHTVDKPEELLKVIGNIKSQISMVQIQ